MPISTLKLIIGGLLCGALFGLVGCKSTQTTPLAFQPRPSTDHIGIASVAVPPNPGYLQPLYQLGYCVQNCPPISPRTIAVDETEPVNTLPKGLVRQIVPLPNTPADSTAKPADLLNQSKTAVALSPSVTTNNSRGQVADSISSGYSTFLADPNKSALVLAPLYFATNKSTLELALPTLKTYDIRALSQASSIRLSGFADHYGTRAYNLTLAQARVNAVRTYLDKAFANLVPAPKALPKWLSGTDSVDPNTPLQLARRVELEVSFIETNSAK